MSSTPVSITVKLNAHLQPEHRLQLFEDPLDAMLEAAGIGEIMGGGTALSDEGEVEYGDLEIQLHDGAALAQVIELLEQLGAPKGSLIQRVGEADLPFGITEGLGLYLDGVNLPDEVYEQCDSNYVFDQIVERIDGHGEICSWWQGPSETALYLYGASFETLRERIAELLATYPLCQGARVVQIA
ncbi:hypothetical protein [Stenotrophomonas sp.]|uniref:hypothetical protein n=1 Tax=Stenotrophomonas sp. TaxID=69392 RepID=UPI0028A6C1EC|nr:hypothetical protein [Stenotrophomonas sp.]